MCIKNTFITSAHKLFLEFFITYFEYHCYIQKRFAWHTISSSHQLSTLCHW